MGQHIDQVVARLTAGATNAHSCDLHSSSVRTVSGPVPVGLARDLEALARLHQRDAACLAGDLLAAALDDVIHALPAAMQEQIRQSKADMASAEAESHREALAWDAGRT